MSCWFPGLHPCLLSLSILFFWVPPFEEYVQIRGICPPLRCFSRETLLPIPRGKLKNKTTKKSKIRTTQSKMDSSIFKLSDSLLCILYCHHVSVPYLKKKKIDDYCICMRMHYSLDIQAVQGSQQFPKKIFPDFWWQIHEFSLTKVLKKGSFSLTAN